MDRLKDTLVLQNKQLIRSFVEQHPDVHSSTLVEKNIKQNFVKMIKDTAKHDWRLLLSTESMLQFNFPLHKQVTVIDGQDLNPKLFGIKH